MASKGLGQLTLDLVLKMAGFEQGMDKAARVTDTRMKQIEKRAYEMGRALGTALKVGVGIAAAGLALYIKNTVEAEKVQAQLGARIKDTFGAAGRSLDQLNAQADKLQGLTVFDDEAIGGAQAMLLTFKNIQGVNFDRATEAVLDLSTAMGVDLNSAALQLGKALNDPIKGLSALGRAGIQFSKDQKEAIKAMVEAGDTAGAQRIILAELEGQMGSAAEAARDTLGGALLALKNSFDNLLEGDSGSGGMTGAREGIEQLIEVMNDPGVKAGVDGIVNGLARITAEAISSLSVLGNYQQKITDIFSLSKKLSSGAALSTFSDQEIALQQSNIAQQLGTARKAGDQAEVNRLIQERVKFQRENTERLKRALGQDAKRDPATDASLFVMEDKDRPNAPGKPKKSGSKRAAGKSDAVREAESLQKAYESMNERLKEQAELFGEAGEAAKVRYEIESGSLKGLDQAKAQELIHGAEKIDQLNAEADAQKVLDDLTKDREDATNTGIEEGAKQIEQMEFELSLLGLGNKERARAIELRYAEAGATEEQKARIAELSDEMYEAEKASEFFSDTWASIGDAFVDVGTRSKTALEAVGDLLDDLYKRALQFLADQAIQAFLGGVTGGTSGGASAGGFLDLFSSASSGFGFASGGYTGPGAPNQIAGIVHAGEYVLNAGATRSLGVGNLNQLNNGAPLRGGGNITNIYVQPTTTRRTADQIAQANERRQRTASLRNG